MKETLLGLSILTIPVLGIAAEGDAYEWPAYSPNIYYNFKDHGITYELPTKNYEGDCFNNAAGHKEKDWYSFIWGSNRRSNVTDNAIDNMLDRFNKDFNYIADTMGWPRDPRIAAGCYGAIYLYGSMACTGSDDSTATGGWQSWIDGMPCVTASYYPVACFDDNNTYYNREDQMSAMVHEGIHSLVKGLACAHVSWFQEGGDTWLQQEMEIKRGGVQNTTNPAEYSGMGFLNACNLIAPFLPIECYSGWLLDGSFGGPAAEGVDAGGKCNWRNTIGGTQYSNLFPTFLGLWMSEGAVPWIWVYTTDASKYILETIADSIGGDQVRRLIMEYHAKLAMCDMMGWSQEMRSLLDANFGSTIACENSPCTYTVEDWYATPYAVTTESNGVLTPENRTTPGWSGANVVPLKISGSKVSVTLQQLGDNMSLQLCYRATDGTPVYSTPVMGNSTAVLNIEKAAQDNVIFAIVCNTDYKYEGDETRTKHHDYRLVLNSGVSGAADTKTKWYNNFKLEYDWASISHTLKIGDAVPTVTYDIVDELSYDVTLPIDGNYKPVTVTLDKDKIMSDLGYTSATDMGNILGNSVYFYGLNANGSFYKSSTAEAPGHWFSAAGNIVTYENDNSTIYSELSTSDMQVNIGHFPNKVAVGDTFTVRQSFVTSDRKQVNLIFHVTIASATGLHTTLADLSDDGEPLLVFYDKDAIVADYRVPYETNVKLSLYTGNGAFITNLVNEKKAIGTYQYDIDINKMELPKGIYLLKYSFPGVQKTRMVVAK